MGSTPQLAPRVKPTYHTRLGTPQDCTNEISNTREETKNSYYRYSTYMPLSDTPPRGGTLRDRDRGLSHGPAGLPRGLAAPRRTARARWCAGQQVKRPFACRGSSFAAAAGAREGAWVAEGSGAAEDDVDLAKVEALLDVVAL